MALKYQYIIFQTTFLRWFAGILILIPFNIFGQSSNIGHSPIRNFDNKTYSASTQNWDISQDKKGIMYFANNAGLLVFDGYYWQTYQVSNRTIVRSVAAHDDGRIFVGAQGEMGYFASNKTGKLVYTSLNQLLASNDQTFADVWGIEIMNQHVFFQTGQNIFHYDGETLKVIYVGSSLSHLCKVRNDIYIYDFEKGILKLENTTFKPVGDTIFFNKNNIEVNGIFQFHQDTLLISTVKNGLLLFSETAVQPWKISANRSLKNGSVYCSEQLDKNHYVLGTSTQGVFIINKKGQVTQHLNHKMGLQVNNVLSVFVDNFHNLWAGLDNGIDYIETNSPFTQIYPDNDLKAMGYAIQIHNDKIYFGTANGVFYNDWKTYYNPLQTTSFKLITNSSGQVWNLSSNQGDLFINHHEGVFVVNDNVATKIDSKRGAWKQITIGQNKLLSGHYSGLVLLEKNGNWKRTVDFTNNWRESCRIIVQDEHNNVWVSHPYRGVFKVQFNDDFTIIKNIETYNSTTGFPSDFQIYVFKIGDEVVFCAEKGVFSYNKSKNRFEPNKKWNEIFGNQTRVKRLIETPKGHIWYVTDYEIGILKIKDGGVYKKIRKQTFPQLKNKLVDGFETIYPYDNENIFIACEQGFMHYDPAKTLIDTNYNAHIRSVQLIGSDSIIHAGFNYENSDIPSINYRQNAIRFLFSATYFGDAESMTFQYFLEGFDEKWSTWIHKNEIDFTNLPAGKYTFHIRAKNINGTISKTATYTFKILAPWYASKVAITIYSLLIGTMIYLLIFIPKQQFEREKAALESKQKQTLLQKEQEHQLLEEQQQIQISKLEKEKLELKIQAKNQELASNTMHLVQKSEVLQKLKMEINKIIKTTSDIDTSKQLRAVIRKISADERLDNDWEYFAKHFDQVHEQFLQRLREKYPQLTPKDHRLCAYLRLNLSSKEIAPLMTISVRSVEVARYRLRKKLELENDVNLVEFMVEV
ncbi:MAG: triple tyrosine motif-containing protein [Saprospiraceae bacterium]